MHAKHSLYTDTALNDTVYETQVFTLQQVAGCIVVLKMVLNLRRICSSNLNNPSIAQLVERWTVVDSQISIGRWFKSGSKEFFLLIYFVFCKKKFSMIV